MSRIKEVGIYTYKIAKIEVSKKTHYPDLILIPNKKYKKKGFKEMRFKFIKFNKKSNLITFKITNRDHIF